MPMWFLACCMSSGPNRIPVTVPNGSNSIVLTIKMLKANNICKDKSLDHESFNELLHWLDTFRMPLDELDNLIVRYHSSTHYETVCKHTFFHYNILTLYTKKTENFGFQYCFQNFRPSTVNAANDSTASLPMRRSPPPTPTEPNKRQRTQETPTTTLSQMKRNFCKRLTLTKTEHEKVKISPKQCDLCYYIKHYKGMKQHNIIRASNKCVKCDAVLCYFHYDDFHDSKKCPSDY